MKGVKMKSFYDLPDKTRFKIYDALKLIDCESHGGGQNPFFSVAVAKGKFSALLEIMGKFGFENNGLYTFPLGTDKPPMHLRHESYGQPNSCWLIANFKLK